MDLRYLNEEQRHQIELHKYLTSESSKKDRGEDACIEWVEKYAASFRAWAESIPVKCIHCGYCIGVADDKDCIRPFNQLRIDMIEKENLNKSDS